MKFNRGDTFAFKIKGIFSNGNIITPSDIKTFYLTCKQSTNKDDIYVFQKEKDDVKIDSEGYIHITFEPKDTENLDVGTYYFDIEITLENDVVKTKTGQFYLDYDITTAKDKKEPVEV